MIHDIVFIGAINVGELPRDGETAKNQILISYLKTKIPNIKVIDTFFWRRNPLVLLRLFLEIVKLSHKAFVISASTNSVYRLSMILYYLKRRSHLYYFVIGNTLAKRVENNQYKTKYLSQFNKIFVEGNAMKASLNSNGLDNVVYLSNFKQVKNIDFLRESPKIKNDTIIHFVFLSRIMKEKGVDLIFDAMASLNVAGYAEKYDVTFYGEISKLYSNSFEAKLKSKNNAFYGGYLNLQTASGYSKLAQYHVMLFPTFWVGEGFPGVIIDSFIAGLPIIASDWSLNTEIVKDKINGLIIKTGDASSLSEAMMFMINTRDAILIMHERCIKEAESYDYEKVLFGIDLQIISD